MFLARVSNRNLGHIMTSFFAQHSCKVATGLGWLIKQLHYGQCTSTKKEKSNTTLRSDVSDHSSITETPGYSKYMQPHTQSRSCSFLKENSRFLSSDSSHKKVSLHFLFIKISIFNNDEILGSVELKLRTIFRKNLHAMVHEL